VLYFRLTNWDRPASIKTIVWGSHYVYDEDQALSLFEFLFLGKIRSSAIGLSSIRQLPAY
jgi:hypothetical protein